jgi:hypothetical protein
MFGYFSLGVFTKTKYFNLFRFLSLFWRICEYIGEFIISTCSLTSASYTVGILALGSNLRGLNCRSEAVIYTCMVVDRLVLRFYF